MKKVFLLLFLVAGTAMAQTGYVQYEALLQSMPEYNTAQSQINKFTETLVADLKKAEKNAGAKMNDLKYKAQAPDVTEAQMQEFGKQAQTLQQEIEREKQLADLKLAAERNKLLDPLTAKLNAAIKKVADAKGFKLIVDVSTVAYSTEGTDISEAVAKELGIPLDQE
ncbi:OmpH family outer membrane protein [Nonlabens xiamenensis]|uniref:OmpH family outer membrane protein n=1 Tax=Nonlabens xiamenensis TaxID=2341043 RepID=UPI000F605CC2|nr:OmpH family outer membrane protein [Nonlabens xiamenensis]